MKIVWPVAVSRQALIAAGMPVAACAIHFPISGGLVFVEGL